MGVPWFDGRMAALDFETTGVDVETDRAVTAHFAMVGGGEDAVTQDWLICPGIEIAEEATAVHGITNEHAREHGRPAPGAIGEIAFAVRHAIGLGLPVVAFNLPFDATLLDRECRRHLIEPPPWHEMMGVDPFVIWKWADRFRRGSRNLTAACECFGVELGDDAHDAGADALAAARVTWRMFHTPGLVQGHHPEIVQRRAHWKRVRESLPALQVAQAAWKAEQADGLRMYFEGRGETEKAASVRGEWPVIPYQEAADDGQAE
jgi:DNA polymerase-3 subunit epsilon